MFSRDLSMKHEVRVMQGQGAAALSTSPRPTARGCAGRLHLFGSKHAVEGITKSVALEIAKSGSV